MPTIETVALPGKVGPLAPLGGDAGKSAESGLAEILKTLDEDQHEACLDNGHIAVAARPGSGKTRLLVARILRGMVEFGPDQVTAVTFTRAAAQEMRKRVEIFAGRKAAKEVSISTFHSLALSFLKKREKRKVIDDRDRFLVLIGLLRERQMRYPVDEVLKVLPDFFNRDAAVLSALPGGVVETLQAYRRYLADNRLADLDALVPRLADLMEKGRARFGARLLLVDEFQDVDPGQLRLTVAIGKQGVETFCVGDDDQSIYGFRRSQGPRAFETVQESLGSRMRFLQTNYRCRRQIAMAAEQPLLCLGERIQKPLRIREDGGMVLGRHFDSGDLEMEAAARFAEAAGGRGTAILARTNHLLDGMEGVLRVLGVPYQREDSRSFWELDEVRKCLAFLSLAYRPNRHDVYVAMHAIPLPYETIRGVVRFLEGLPKPGSREELIDALYDRRILEGANVEIVEHFRDWRRMFCDWAEHCGDERQWEAAEMVFRTIAEKQQKSAMINAAGILAKVFASPGRDGRLVPVEERLRWLELPKDATPAQGCGVEVMTIHAAKGLEFERVWILGARKGVLPHQDSEDEDEERRILYVGMTRAEKELVVSNSRERMDLPMPPFSFDLRLETDETEEQCP